MTATIGKILRLSEFWQEGQKSLLVDATLPGALGPLPGLESPSVLVEQLATLADGLILNPGLADRFADRFSGKLGAAPLVRLDWTNVARPADFCLPLHTPRRVSLASPTDAVQMGATAAVASLLLGFDEEFEAHNIQAIAFAAREAVRVSLPLLADIHLAGPKVDPARRDAAIELGVSFMVEAGADGIFLPLPSAKSLRLLLEYAPIPLFIRIDTAAALHDLSGALSAGIAGLVVGDHALAAADEVLAQARTSLRQGAV